MSLIATLSESKLFPSTTFFKKYESWQIGDIAYLYLLALRILQAEPSSYDEARAYFKRTTRNTDWKKWRTDATDLYACLHIITAEHIHLAKGERKHAYASAASLAPVKSWLNTGGHGTPNDAATKRMFAQIDSLFHIRNTSMRSVRRLIRDWPDLSLEDQKLAMTRLLQFLRSRASGGELIAPLEKLAAKKKLEIKDVENQEKDAAKATKEGRAPNLLLALENATAGATASSSIATSIGGSGTGFAPDQTWRSPYGDPPKPRKIKRMPLLRRQPDPE